MDATVKVNHKAPALEGWPVHKPSRGKLLVQIMKKLVAAGNDARIGAIIAKLAEVDGLAHCQNAQRSMQCRILWRGSHTTNREGAACRTTR